MFNGLLFKPVSPLWNSEITARIAGFNHLPPINYPPNNIG